MPAHTCPLCKKPVKPGERFMYVVTGFEEPRTQGGANMIHWRQRAGRAHWMCVETGKPVRRRALPDPDQTTLDV